MSDRKARMTLSWRLLIFATIVCLIAPAIGTQANRAIAQTPSPTENSCPPPVHSGITRHKIVAGETLESIANRYNLIPATLIAFNPGLTKGPLPVGREILIPPFNGIRVQVPVGVRWEDVAATYGVRADILYELNGCQKTPGQVFVPGMNLPAQGGTAVDTYTGFDGYPLPSTAPVALSYGWYQEPKTGEVRFHSGIDLLADPDTPVLSVEAGTVAFAGEQGSYGNLVVVNHQDGRQTRYAHLNNIFVGVGQQVKLGDKLGTVGSTGRPDINKPHLHFEVRYSSPEGWVAQDPEPHLKAKPTAQRL